jgi:hypothetical protein
MIAIAPPGRTRSPSVSMRRIGLRAFVAMMRMNSFVAT